MKMLCGKCSQEREFVSYNGKKYFICRACEPMWDQLGDEVVKLETPTKPPMPKKENDKQPEKVGITKKAANFTKAVTKHAFNGFRKTPSMVYRSRIDICNSCEFLLNNKECGKCGCPVAEKASWASEQCPIGKWEVYKETTGKCGGCGRK
jgi:hypothetical protein|tara:strand:- start:143 stop:592 length:450 start_codon:yes stop_codon:yes gene_type:complete